MVDPGWTISSWSGGIDVRITVSGSSLHGRPSGKWIVENVNDGRTQGCLCHTYTHTYLSSQANDRSKTQGYVHDWVNLSCISMSSDLTLTFSLMARMGDKSCFVCESTLRESHLRSARVFGISQFYQILAALRRCKLAAYWLAISMHHWPNKFIQMNQIQRKKSNILPK